MKFQHPVTPAEMSVPLTALCKSIVPDATPLYIDLRPLNGTPPDECFPIVESQVATYGGDLVMEGIKGVGNLLFQKLCTQFAPRRAIIHGPSQPD